MNWVVPTIAVSLLEGLLSRLITMDPNWPGNAQTISGQVIELELTDLSIRLFFLPSTKGMVVQSSFADKANVRISGSLSGFLKLIQARRKGETLIGGDVRFEGDVAAGQQFEKLMASLSPEWEESLSRLVGDPIAHQASQFAKELGNYLTQATDLIRQNTKDYVQEEARFSPAVIEVENFSTDVAELRSDLARLEARVRRLNALTGTNQSNKETSPVNPHMPEANL